MDKGHLKQYAVGLAVATIFASAGMVYGWAAPMTIRLQSKNSEVPINEEESAYVIAAIEFGDIFTPIPAGFIADRFGRKPVILSAVPLYLIGWALIILTRSFSTLILARILFGMAMGIIFSVCPIYLGEIAEPEIRGKVTMVGMSFWFLGMVASYSIGPYVSYSTFSYISVTVPISLAFILCFIPESPYNLLSRGKYKEAFEALKKIRSGNDAAIEKEAKLIKDAIDELGGKKMSCITLLIDPCCRMSLFLIIILGFVALFGGVTVMYAYATEIFQKIDGIPLDADQCTIFLGVIYCILCLLVTGFVDLFGRRPLLLISAGGSGLCHFIIGLYFYLQDYTSVDISSHGWILLLAVGGYCIFTSIGINPITPVYQSEIFPDGIKGRASGLFILEQCTFSMIALKLFQVINFNFGKHVSFWFFSIVNVVGFILLHFYLIETKGKTLAEIQREFKIRLKIIEPTVDTKETIPFKDTA